MLVKQREAWCKDLTEISGHNNARSTYNYTPCSNVSKARQGVALTWTFAVWSWLHRSRKAYYSSFLNMHVFFRHIYPQYISYLCRLNISFGVSGTTLRWLSSYLPCGTVAHTCIYTCVSQISTYESAPVLSSLLLVSSSPVIRLTVSVEYAADYKLYIMYVIYWI